MAEVRNPPAVLEQYRRRGWRITPGGRPDAGITAGPCGRCRQPIRLYGPNGRALCSSCEGGTDG